MKAEWFLKWKRSWFLKWKASRHFVDYETLKSEAFVKYYFVI
jgi:hypothetical protein